MASYQLKIILLYMIPYKFKIVTSTNKKIFFFTTRFLVFLPLMWIICKISWVTTGIVDYLLTINFRVNQFSCSRISACMYFRVHVFPRACISACMYFRVHVFPRACISANRKNSIFHMYKF